MTSADLGPVRDVGATIAGCPADLAAALEQSGIDRATVLEFLDAQRRAGLLHGERPLCSVLSPLVLSRSFYRRVEAAAALVCAAMERLVTRALIDDELRCLLGVDERERALYQEGGSLPPAPAVVIGRLDMMVTRAEQGGDGFAFIELNAESPAGISDQIGIEQTLYQLPPLRRWLAGRRPHRTDAPRALLEALRETHRRWGGDGDPSIAIVDWSGIETASEQQWLARFFSAEGIAAVCADPGELRFEGGRLWTGERRIDLVYRRTLTREILERTDAAHPLRRALRERAVCVVNPLHSTIANRKAALAVLSDPAWEHLFSDEQVAALREHVPWSRVLDRRAADHDELAELITERQQDMVIKPNDAFGGRGVVPGWTVDAPTWRESIARAFAEGGVVQQRLHPRQLSFPSFAGLGDDGASFVWQELGFDCNPFLFGGRVEGAMVRVSAEALSNVSAGGGITGLLIDDDPADDSTERGDARV